jgi:hypothetical protein
MPAWILFVLTGVLAVVAIVLEVQVVRTYGKSAYSLHPRRRR